MSAYLPRFFFFFFFNDTATTEIYTLSLHDALPISDIGTSVPISQSVIGRAFLAACTPPEREAVLNQMKVKEPEAHRKFRPSIYKSLEDIRARGFCASMGELRREVYGVGVPMRRTVDGEIVSFNCAVPAFMVKKGQLEEDLGPRLVAMRSEEHTSELQSRLHLVCRLLLEKK